MKKFLYKWRYYSFEKDLYYGCINKLFIGNLNGLRHANLMVAGFAFLFSLFPLLYDRNLIAMGVCLAAAVIAAGLALYLNYKMQVAIVDSAFIYVFTTLFYINVMILCIYLDIWAYGDKKAVLFFVFLLCVLLMFVNPPVFNLCLILGAVIIFLICAFIFKSRENFVFDVVNASFASIMSLFLSWQITKLRIGLELSANMLEEERNKYIDQSIIDELTQLNNRRDFFKTFQRYISAIGLTMISCA